MTGETTARLDIVPVWRKLNDMLIELVDIVPDDKMDWSPKPELWSFDHIFRHLADAREEWMNRAINDGEPDLRVFENAHSNRDIKAAFQRTWERVERTVTDQERLDATYRDRWWAGAPLRTGHWVAFHLLEHDIHHRADLLLYLSLLGVETRPGLDMVG
ncbi:MAG: DinB family protein [Dehalococcoidia bacterium]